jgi:DNA-binding NarL/FixJ family response regulator
MEVETSPPCPCNCRVTTPSRRPPIRVALVEDHAATRDALVTELSDFSDRLQLVAAFADARVFLRASSTLRVDVVLVDLGLPSLSGTEAIEALARTMPNVRAIALTAFSDEKSVVEAIRAGAYGYLLKDEPIERLVRAIEEAAAGENPVSSRVAGFLIARARRAPPPVALSDRETELSVALADGLSYAECGARMGVTLGTVQEYVKRLYRKLDVNSRKEVREWVELNATPR